MSRTPLIDPCPDLPQGLRFLQVASVAGNPFRLECVRAAGELDADVAALLLGPLCQRGILRAAGYAPGGARLLAFVDEDLRRDLYNGLPATSRADLHRCVAETLGHAIPPANAEAIAEHLEQAGELRQAGEWYFRAGRMAIIEGRNTDALHWFDTAFLLLPPEEDGAPLRHACLEERARLLEQTTSRLSPQQLLAQVEGLDDLPPPAGLAETGGAIPHDPYPRPSTGC